ncbi:spermatogenesis-associated protein 17 [Halyomorpha halys]|uniref:spermatogenesis-associated protein 17 n=1 Tax=Halyomorpha halys TaxID=286706 RepID=UPI0006D4F3AD|nr:spermatogenesis-associated protein 17 [Halyomorpha halys]
MEIGLNNVDDTLNEYLYRQRFIEDCCLLVKYKAATAIQRWVRGFLTRNHMTKLNKAAIVIQRYYRGYLGRQIEKDYVNHYFITHIHNEYNRYATIIQSYWRGYCVRKVFDFKKLKEWQKKVVAENEHLVKKMHKFHNMESDFSKYIKEKDLMNWIVYIVFKTHHMVRTYSIPGIYSTQGTTQLSKIEHLMKQILIRGFMEGLKDERVKYILKILDFKNSFDWRREFSNMTKWEKSWRGRHCLRLPAVF